jgi:peptidyl-prolyl cis-trans isomerase SurA
MMIKRLVRRKWLRTVFLLTALGPFAAAPGNAQDTLRAAALVNDEVISVLDLAMRTRLAILASGLQDSPEVRGRLQQQVLRNLIDERLQLQEAERLDISVPKGQLENQIDNLAQQNKMTRQQFVRFLAQNNVLPKALTDQIRGSLTWQSVVQRRLRPSVEISDEEVDEIIGRLESSEGRNQFLAAEILLAVDNAAREEEVKRTAERLVEQIRRGADFAALAQQFSQSATASVGGDLGWIEEGQLHDELNRVLTRMRRGNLAGPIRSFGGYYILLLRDQRRISMGDSTVNLKQLLFALSADASAELVAQTEAKAAEVGSQVESCDSVETLAEQYGSAGSGDLGNIKLSQLPPKLRNTVAPLPVGQPSPPVRVAAGISVVVVCDRTRDGVDRERIRESLANQRLDMLARRYLRDLRRAANVDLRL